MVRLYAVVGDTSSILGAGAVWRCSLGSISMETCLCVCDVPVRRYILYVYVYTLGGSCTVQVTKKKKDEIDLFMS